MTVIEVGWAEEFVLSRKAPIDAAIVRGSELWILFNSPKGERSVAVFQYVRPGEEVPDRALHETRVEGGDIYLLYAWQIDSVPMREHDQDCKQALIDAEQRLTAFTNPEERKDKVIELLRWSARAGQTDFSAADD